MEEKLGQTRLKYSLAQKNIRNQLIQKRMTSRETSTWHAVRALKVHIIFSPDPFPLFADLPGPSASTVNESKHENRNYS